MVVPLFMEGSSLGRALLVVCRLHIFGCRFEKWDLLMTALPADFIVITAIAMIAIGGALYEIVMKIEESVYNKEFRVHGI